MKATKLELDEKIHYLEKKHQNAILELKKIEMEKARLEHELKFSEARFRHYQLTKDKSKNVRIIFITPTYKRFTQKADLVRLSQTLINVPNILWIVVEDADEKNENIYKFLNNSAIPFAHLCSKTPENKKLHENDPNWLIARGVKQRNEALKWIRVNLINHKNAVIYFGDDDNTYDLKLFNEMRTIKKVGIWPVGIVGGLIVEGPLISQINGSVIGFNSIWKPERTFPIDMAAFAFNISLLHDFPNAQFMYNVPRGYQESHILSSFNISLNDLEPKANMCRNVYVWHTRTEKVSINQKDRIKFNKGYGITKLEEDALFF
uniref:Galactosylgalactosylxylosylprotein 3-beta-glucuronosyltransferase n=1 Tax=Parastrongyloides trichosuri TaxID=131310 RepID=A0A0N4ZWN8_PARTI